MIRVEMTSLYNDVIKVFLQCHLLPDSKSLHDNTMSSMIPDHIADCLSLIWKQIKSFYFQSSIILLAMVQTSGQKHIFPILYTY